MAGERDRREQDDAADDDREHSGAAAARTPVGSEAADGAGAERNRRRASKSVIGYGASLVVIVVLAAVVGWLAWGYFSEPSGGSAEAAVGQTITGDSSDSGDPGDPDGTDEGDDSGGPAGTAPVVLWGRGTGPATGAVQAAASGVQALFGYRYGDVEESLDKASDQLTGEFQSRFRDYVATDVVPAAKERQATVKAMVVGAAPVRFDGDTAAVMVFLDQTASSADSDKTAFTPSQVMASLRHVDGKWLIDDVERITG